MKDYSVKMKELLYGDDVYEMKTAFYKLYVIDESFNRLLKHESDGLKYILDVETCYYTPFQHKKNTKRYTSQEELFSVIEKEYKRVMTDEKLRADYKKYLTYERKELFRLQRRYNSYLLNHEEKLDLAESMLNKTNALLGEINKPHQYLVLKK